MSLDEDELIGVWSRGAGYYATFSEEFLIFKPDGTGRLEFLVALQHDSVKCFRWRIVSPGVLDLIGESNFHFTSVPYSVAEKERPPGTGQWMQVLQFGSSLPWPSDLGLVTKDVSEWERQQGSVSETDRA